MYDRETGNTIELNAFYKKEETWFGLSVAPDWNGRGVFGEKTNGENRERRNRGGDRAENGWTWDHDGAYVITGNKRGQRKTERAAKSPNGL